MTQIRVYLPLAAAQCRELAGRLALGPPPRAYAVTESVRGSDPSGDEEAWEYAALLDAARSCVQAGVPVVVAAADLGPEVVDASSPSGSRVTVTGAVPLQRIAAFHVGDDVLTGGPVSTDTDLELSWYDTTELELLLDLL